MWVLGMCGRENGTAARLGPLMALHLLRRTLGLSLVSCVLCSGCSYGGDDYDGALRGGRLERTSFDSWELREYPLAGIKVDVPTDAFRAGASVRGVFVSLHPVSPPPLVLDDAQPMVKITLDRIGQEKFEARQKSVRRSNLYRQGDEELRSFLDGLASWHDESTRYLDSGYTYFRRDIDCRDGSVVKTKAELINLRRDGVAVHETEDEAAIRRIFDSIECIEQVIPGQSK